MSKLLNWRVDKNHHSDTISYPLRDTLILIAPSGLVVNGD